MKALIAMSGGVDSSVAAALTKEMGYDCIGVTMKLYTNEVVTKCEKTCCSLDDVEDARNVAIKLQFPYYVFNFTDTFEKEVINRFIYAYENGATPNPCIDCNRYLKFDRLYKRGIELGCDKIVTGHYARIEKSPDGRYLLKKAKDKSKDQSYVLYSLTQKQLKATLFPVGDYEKTEIRDIAEKHSFYNSNKKDSQDICFVPDGNYVKFIENFTNKKYKSGNFIDINGNIVGTHKGIINYTIGQRKGLNLNLNKPVYVIKKNIKDNTVTIGDNNDLLKKGLIANDFNWISMDAPKTEIKAKAKIRYNQEEKPATIIPIDGNKYKIIFNYPERAIAKGQAVVLYDDDTVVGGGTIIDVI